MTGTWFYITYEIVHYKDEKGNTQVAYCLNPELDGIGWAHGSIEGYNVNLTEVLSDIRIWRVCINGYPYKTPKDLGVETNEDAYLATKQAIYSVLRKYWENPQRVYDEYRAGETTIAGENLADIQRRGKKVVDAIYNLVKISNDTSITPANSKNINVNKIGNLQKDTKQGYYSQNYSVSSKINMESYTITDKKGFPEGTIITDSKGNVKNTFSKNENFKVLIPEKMLKTNISGSINISAKSENYPIFYGLSQIKGYQNYAVCSDAYGDIPVGTTLNLNTNISKIIVSKTDIDTSKPIEKVMFSLFKDGKEISRAETNSSGTISFTNLYPGDYSIKEIKTDDSYVLNKEEIKVSVEYNEEKTVNVTNEKKKGKIQVIKVDKDNNSIKIPDVTFEVLDENKNVVDTITTNANGEAVTKSLPIDKTYTVKETKTKEEYVLSNNVQTVKLEQNQIKTIQFENEKKKGQIKVIKQDEDYKDIKIPNVEFKIYNSKGEVVDTIITNEKGEATTKKLAIDDTYTIKETKTDRKYILNNNEITVTLKQDEIKECIVTNEHKKGQIEVFKTDAENKEIKLEGVEFQVLDSKSNIVDTIITNKDGYAVTKKLPIGTYYLKETRTNKDYVLNEEVKKVDVTENVISKLEITNVKIKKLPKTGY